MKANTESRGTVLVMDDDPAVLLLIREILTASDYRVLLAAERADAIRLVGQKHIHIDIALLDVHMPGVTGTEVADELLAIRPNLRVLWMSGFVDDDVIRIKMIEGYAGFLAKPLRPAGLLLALEAAMKEESGESGQADVQQTHKAGAGYL